MSGRRAALASAVKGFAERSLSVQTLTCSGPGCRRFTLAHRRLRRDGILLRVAVSRQDWWLCSPECFSRSLHAQMDAYATPGPRDGGVPPRMPFRLHLLRAEVVSVEDLQRAQDHAFAHGMTFAAALRALELATEDQIGTAIASEQGCSFFAVPPVPQRITLRLPFPLAQRFDAATVFSTEGRLYVGFVARVERSLLRLAGQMTGLQAEPCIITAKRLAEQRACEGMASAEAELARTPVQSASSQLLAQALECGAERVQIGAAGRLLWARMWNEAGAVRDGVWSLSREEPA